MQEPILVSCTECFIVTLLQESLPPEYARIFAFDNFTKTQKHVVSEVLNRDQGSMNDCSPVGSYTRLHIKHVPVDVASKLCSLSRKSPVIACGLLQHESKMSVLHFRYFFDHLLVC